MLDVGDIETAKSSLGSAKSGGRRWVIDLDQCSKCSVTQSYDGMVIRESDDGCLPRTLLQVGI